MEDAQTMPFVWDGCFILYPHPYFNMIVMLNKGIPCLPHLTGNLPEKNETTPQIAFKMTELVKNLL